MSLNYKKEKTMDKVLISRSASGFMFPEVFERLCQCKMVFTSMATSVAILDRILPLSVYVVYSPVGGPSGDFIKEAYRHVTGEDLVDFEFISPYRDLDGEELEALHPKIMAEWKRYTDILGKTSAYFSTVV